MPLDIILNILSNPWALILTVLFFGASIFVHELGHYLAARWRGLKIERFSIGFGPRLFGWTDKNGIDYRVSLFPLGGYVALPQLADMRGIEGESEINPEALPPLGYMDKMIVSVAGAVFNVIFAFFLASILYFIGTPVDPDSLDTRVGYVLAEQSLPDGQKVAGAAYVGGIQAGDRIVAVDGAAVTEWMDLFQLISTGTLRNAEGSPQCVVAVERDQKTFEVTLYPRLTGEEQLRTIGISRAESLTVHKVFPNSPAEISGLSSGDEILTMNGDPVYSRSVISAFINDHPGKSVLLGGIRADNTRFEVNVTPEEVVLTSDGQTHPMIGVQWEQRFITHHVLPWTQIKNAYENTIQVLVALLHPHSNIGLSNLSGPIGISYAIYLTSLMGFSILLGLIVLINVNLAILNLLPIPVLDGGHMAFATWQKLTGKRIPPNFIGALQGSFMILLLSMVLYVSFFDVSRVGRNEKEMLEADRSAVQHIKPVFKSGLKTQSPEQP
jgi:regulator of sigma E protease